MGKTFKVITFFVVAFFLFSVVVDRSIYGPPTEKAGKVEWLIEKGKLSLNPYRPSMIGADKNEETNVYFVARKDPVLSWIPGVTEYYICYFSPEHGFRNFRIEDGSKLHKKVKRYHKKLKAGRTYQKARS